VATIDGKQITAKQALDLLKPFTQEERKRYESNLPGLVQQIYMREQLADQASKLNLDQQSPWKEQIQMARASILSQAYLNQMAAKNSASAPAETPRHYYDTHGDEFEQVALSGIFIGFAPPGTPASAKGGTTRTEEQARQKAADLEKKIAAGGDFAALARTDSDNQQAAEHGGDLGTYTIGDPRLPPDIKTALSKLQAGQVSDPIRLQGAFLILKVNSRTKLPFEKAEAQITQKQQDEKSQAALKQELDKYKIQVQDPDFFNASNTPSLQRPGTVQAPQAAPKPQAKR
jgi:hypothetical protein